MSNTNVKAATQYTAPVHRHIPVVIYELVSFDKSKENPISFEDVSLNVISTMIYLDKTRVRTHTDTPDPYIRATVTYTHNCKALHDVPFSTSTNFTFRDFEKHHSYWLEHITEYSIDRISSNSTRSDNTRSGKLNNVDEIIANALIIASVIRESSWKHADATLKCGAYQLTKYEAADAAALKMGIPESFAQLIDILLTAAWNDSLVWANRVLNSSKSSKTIQENLNASNFNKRSSKKSDKDLAAAAAAKYAAAAAKYAAARSAYPLLPADNATESSTDADSQSYCSSASTSDGGNPT